MFRRDQTGTADVREFLTRYDSFRLPGSRVWNLFGNVVTDFEGVDCAVAAHPEIRVRLRRLHAIWSWSGFFLALNRPLGRRKYGQRVPVAGRGAGLMLAIFCGLNQSLWNRLRNRSWTYLFCLVSKICGLIHRVLGDAPSV
jgi:hypothetical protein